MSDEIVARRESRPPHPAGAYPGVCVDVIDLGDTVDTYQGRTQILPKLVLVFQTNAEDPDTGKPLEIHVELTNSFGQKARLRKFLTGWRGKAYSDEEAAAGVPLHKLEKANGLLNVIHKTSQAGNVYAIIDSMMPPMKGMARIEAIGYTRAPFWAKRKEDYAAAVAVYRKQNGMGGGEEMAAALANGEDDDLPF